MTKKGLLIWNILQEAYQNHRHLSAEEIYLEAKKQDAAIAMATVYNNLNTLEAEGKIRRMRNVCGPDYFDGNVSVHDHLVCDCCKEISDITLKDFAKDLEKRVGTKITGYDLNIHYVCPKCRAKYGDSKRA